MATHSSTLAWKIPWMEEPGRLQSMGSLRVRHNWVTSLSLFTFMRWRRKWQPTPVFLPGESQGWGSLVGCCPWGHTVGHDWATSLSLSCVGEGNGNPLQCSCLENPRDGGAWWAAIYGVAWSRTRLKWLSSSSSSLNVKQNLNKWWREGTPGGSGWRPYGKMMGVVKSTMSVEKQIDLDDKSSRFFLSPKPTCLLSRL